MYLEEPSEDGVAVGNELGARLRAAPRARRLGQRADHEPERRERPAQESKRIESSTELHTCRSTAHFVIISIQ